MSTMYITHYKGSHSIYYSLYFSRNSGLTTLNVTRPLLKLSLDSSRSIFSISGLITIPSAQVSGRRALRMVAMRTSASISSSNSYAVFMMGTVGNCNCWHNCTNLSSERYSNDMVMAQGRRGEIKKSELFGKIFL